MQKIELTEAQQQILDTFAQSMTSLVKMEKLTLNEVCAITGLNIATIKKCRKGTGNMSSYIRLADGLGYNIVFVKARKTKKVNDSIDSIFRLSKIKSKLKQQTKNKQHELREQSRTSENIFD